MFKNYSLGLGEGGWRICRFHALGRKEIFEILGYNFQELFPSLVEIAETKRSLKNVGGGGCEVYPR